MAKKQAKLSKKQFNKAQAAAEYQFMLQMEQQEAQAEYQGMLQQRQFEQAQLAQEDALKQQLAQNEKLAQRSEEAANRARGMMDVNGLEQAPSIRSNSKARKSRRTAATAGTSQLTNPLTISMGGA
jgi:hypothetical protein